MGEQQIVRVEATLRRGGMLLARGDGVTRLLDEHATVAALDALLRTDDVEERVNALLELDGERAVSWQWRQIAEEFPPSDGLWSRLATARQVLPTRTSILDASGKTIERLAIGGFLLSVIALGVLLGTRPASLARWRGADPSPDATGHVLVAVALLALLSLYNLVATLVTARTGAVPEMNPLAQRLLDSPTAVTVFKARAVGGASVVLVAFRHMRAS
jgi:hypothetical protein